MAIFERMIPHVLRWEVGITAKEEGLGPREMYDSVAKRGYHCIAGDRGEHTMCGVTLQTFREWRRRAGKKEPDVEELKRLGYDEWLSILRGMFWDPCKGDRIRNQSVAEMLVDWRWVNGTQGVRDAQTVMSCAQDGVVGPKTLAALNDADARSVFTRLKAAREAAYHRIVRRNPAQGKFLRGWLNRTNSIKFTE